MTDQVTDPADPPAPDPVAVVAAPAVAGPSRGQRRAVAASGLPTRPRKVRPISLRRHVRTTFAVAIAAALVITTIGVVGFWALLDARENVVDRADPALLASSELLAGLVDQETGVRAYVLIADPAFLAPYERGETESDLALARVERLGGGFPGVATALDEVDAAVDDWRDEYVEPTLDGVAAGDPSVRSEATLDAGRERFDAIRAAMGELRSSLSAAREDARQELSTTTVRLVVALAVSAMVLLALVAFLWRLIRLGVEGPLHQLGQDAQQVSGGDLSHAVQPVGPVELQALGGAME